jgi:hypothetical protein
LNGLRQSENFSRVVQGISAFWRLLLCGALKPGAHWLARPLWAGLLRLRHKRQDFNRCLGRSRQFIASERLPVFRKHRASRSMPRLVGCEVEMNSREGVS